MPAEIRFAIATAPSRTAKRWKNSTVTWQEFTERLRQPIRTGETAAEYKAMKKAERDIRKDQGGFVGGYLKDGIRKKGHVVERQLVCLDADNIPEAVDFPALVEKNLDSGAYALYTTHSHTPKAPRFRLIVPLDRPVSEEEYEPIARAIAQKVGINSFDPTTYEACRLMHWPSAARDGEYIEFDTQDPLLTEADKLLQSYKDWRDATAWPISQMETTQHRQAVKKLGDPREKPGLIGAFCKAYTISQAIKKFLPDVYAPCDGYDNRYTYTAGSTTGGFIVYDDLLAYSHHSTDPISGRDVNAFDLVRLNLYGEQDAQVDEDTPVNKRPSFVAMTSMCQQDEGVKRIQNEELKDALSDKLLEEGADTDSLDWLDDLERTKQGKIIANAHNLLLILNNDINMKCSVSKDLFASRLTVRRDLPWREIDTGQTNVWSDSDDSQLRNYLSTTYEGLVGKSIIDDCLTEVAEKGAFHPVRDWLRSLVWDGMPRAETLLIDFLGAPDTPYIREITVKFFKAAIARVFRPGCKFDYCLVMSGPQGIGKSTILNRMGGKWYQDSLSSIKGKDAMEQLQGYWIVEMGEMQAVSKVENEEIKAYISRQTDKFRESYGRRVTEHPRQCVFAATTNDRIFLRDRTGGRRFWIAMCSGEGRKALAELTPDYAAQCWAELMRLYAEDDTLILSKDAEATATDLQEQHTEGAEKIGLIQNFLDTPIPIDWYDNRPDGKTRWTLEDRRAYFNGTMEEAADVLVDRERVCAMEIWCECFENNARNLRNVDAREINTIMQRMDGWKPYESNSRGKLKFKLYGVQRAYIRDKKGGNGFEDLF